LFTFVYFCLLLFTFVYFCLLLFTFVYFCLLLFTFVYFCLPLFLYFCLFLFTFVYFCLLLFTLCSRLKISSKLHLIKYSPGLGFRYEVAFDNITTQEDQYTVTISTELNGRTVTQMVEKFPMGQQEL
jgi:hypothetical protein